MIQIEEDIKQRQAKYGPKREWWVRIPKSLWHNHLSDLKPVERCVYIDLKIYENGNTRKAYPSIRRMANNLSVDTKTIMKALNVLINKNLISKRKGGRKNIYLVC